MDSSSVAGNPSVMDGQPFSVNGVQVRNMTERDCEFVGSLVVKAFESKMVHTVGKDNLDNVAELFSESFRAGNTSFERIFIAEVDGRPAGFLEIKLPGDRESERENEAMRRASSRMGCCANCRLGCLFLCLSEGNIKRGHLYVATLAVADGFRGKGVGKILLGVADQQAQANNCNRAYLWVSTDNRATNLYSREGYVVEKRENSCWVSCVTGKSGFQKMVKRY